MLIHIPRFDGMLPKVAPRKLGVTQAQRASNARLWSGDMRSIQQPFTLEALGAASDVQSIYRLDGNWLRWCCDVDVVKNPTPEALGETGTPDPERIYYSGQFDPKATDAEKAIAGGGTQYPNEYYRLGVVRPNTAPSISVAGGTLADTTRSYTYTFVTEWGEEGPPALIGEATGASDGTWTVSGMDAAVPNVYTFSDVDKQATYVDIEFTAASFLEDEETVVISGVVGMTDLNDTWRVRNLYEPPAYPGQYDAANQDATTPLNNTNTAVGQSFTGNGKKLVSASFMLSKTASPTGTAVAKLYAHTGTYGTSSIPTGPVLATSKTVDVSTLTGTLTLTAFNFGVGERPVLVDTTNYVIVVEYTAGTAVNYVNVGTDTSTPSHPGNFSIYAASWSAVAGTDAVFRVQTEGILNTVRIYLTTAQSYTSGGAASLEAEFNTTNMVKRIYRTNADGDFLFVAEVPLSHASYDDTKADDEIGTVPLPVNGLERLSPPRRMKGLTIMPGGFLVGFVDNQICLSYPYQPYAWPTDYRLPVDYPIVGLGVYGNTLVIATTGTPYIATGQSPDVLSITQLDFRGACIAKRGIVPVLTGVFYPSPTGYIYVGTGGVQNATEGLMDKKEWQLYNPSSFVAAMHDDRIVAFYTDAGEDENESGGIIFDPDEPTARWQETNETATAAWLEDSGGDMFYAKDNSLLQWDAAAVDLSAFWRSKEFKTPRPVAMLCAKVRVTFLSEYTDTDQQTAVAAALAVVTQKKANNEIVTHGTFAGYQAGQYAVASGPYLETAQQLGPTSGLTFKLLSDGDVLFTKTVSDEKPFRINMTEKRDKYEIELSGFQAQVHEVLVATSMSDLAAA